ncbi:nickel pincer cofactor biosynthesis protein LarB [Verrucomicrobiaceae bacterium N1E253]|uniref:Nickel pincer cofactor biosynthesis protein LarB n=1 Tax=Oceaniferula marina TaxID=2748318 RepID=A0A851GAH1_9BACT|nr:nickel pincer cofactor biosynthesis protein LarB [Oceaniferula marina]NWK54396.1 nickel pincer cofactor biosynthesis protein LarB [Oceaniferula marina]
MFEKNHSTLDTERLTRQGFPEVVYCEGKSAGQIIDNLRALADAHGRALGTRLPTDRAEEVLQALPEARYDALGRTIVLGDNGPTVNSSSSVALVSAGTSDLPVAMEASASLSFLGHTVTAYTDIGVAGIHRTLDRMDDIRKASVVIVVAGMEGALPTVVGGLVSAPVIAVPTSVGYGASFHGLAAMLGMLNSCASGLVVVNIDNGFGAAMAAHRILTHQHQSLS